MGLNTYLEVSGIERPPTIETVETVILQRVYPDLSIQDTVRWNSHGQTDGGLHSELIEEIDTTNYIVVESATAADTANPLDGNTPLYSYLRRTTDNTFWKYIHAISEQSQTNEITDIRIYGTSGITEQGIEYWEFTSVPQHSYIDNNQTVSVESFSEYEAIRIVSPSGVQFQPMIADSNVRILSESRLPFNNSSSVVQGFLENKPLVMSNDMAAFGDIQWNAPSYGLQYLQLQSSGGIYDLDFEAVLVPRDPEKRVVPVQLGYTDIFQLKIRFVQLN